MNAKVEQILRKQAYDFAIMCGKSESEALVEADNKIKNVNKLAERDKKEKWVDITTGKKHTPKNPY